MSICECCKEDIPEDDDYYNNYGGLCEGCWTVRPAFDAPGGEDFDNGCEHCN